MSLLHRSSRSNQRSNPPEIWPIPDRSRRRRSGTPRTNRDNSNSMSADSNDDAGAGNVNNLQGNNNNDNPLDANGAGGQGAAGGGAANDGAPPAGPAPDAAPAEQVRALRQILPQTIMQRSQAAATRVGTVATLKRQRLGGASTRVSLRLSRRNLRRPSCGARPLITGTSIRGPSTVRLFSWRSRRGCQSTSDLI